MSTILPLSRRISPSPWWRDDDGFIASGAGDSYETLFDADCGMLDIDTREANKDAVMALPELLRFAEACSNSPAVAVALERAGIKLPAVALGVVAAPDTSPLPSESPESTAPFN